jgi:hypothetical protein
VTPKIGPVRLTHLVRGSASNSVLRAAPERQYGVRIFHINATVPRTLNFARLGIRNLSFRNGARKIAVQASSKMPARQVSTTLRTTAPTTSKIQANFSSSTYHMESPRRRPRESEFCGSGRLSGTTTFAMWYAIRVIPLRLVGRPPIGRWHASLRFLQP